MFTKKLMSAAATVAFGCTGCATTGFGPEKSMTPDERFNTGGVTALTYPHIFEVPDLVTLLDPANARKDLQVESKQQTLLSSAVISSADGVAVSNEARFREGRATINAAFHAFYAAQNALYGTLEDRRNRVQDRLIGASNQRCGDYKIYLRRFESYSDTAFGLGATVAGAISSVTRHLGTGQAWAALSALSAGAGATVKQGVFANLASYIIIPGIDMARGELMAEIEQRRTLDIARYTVERAVADATRFHGACTIETGLERAKQSIQTDEDPGASAMNRMLGKLAVTQDAQRLLAKAQSPAGLTADELTKARTYARLATGQTPTTAAQSAQPAPSANARTSAAALRDKVAEVKAQTDKHIAAHKALLAASAKCVAASSCARESEETARNADRLLTDLAPLLYASDSAAAKANATIAATLLERDKRILARQRQVLTWRDWQFKASTDAIDAVKQLVDVCESALDNQTVAASLAFSKMHGEAALALEKALPLALPATAKTDAVRAAMATLANLQLSQPAERSAGCDEALAVFQPKKTAAKE